MESRPPNEGWLLKFHRSKPTNHVKGIRARTEAGLVSLACPSRCREGEAPAEPRLRLPPVLERSEFTVISQLGHTTDVIEQGIDGPAIEGHRAWARADVGCIDIAERSTEDAPNPSGPEAVCRARTGRRRIRIAVIGTVIALVVGLTTRAPRPRTVAPGTKPAANCGSAPDGGSGISRSCCGDDPIGDARRQDSIHRRSRIRRVAQTQRVAKLVKHRGLEIILAGFNLGRVSARRTSSSPEPA